MGEKFLVMSLDDGVTQDERVISVFRKYALTATFNLNAGRLGEREEIPVSAYDGKPLRHDKVSPEQVRNGLYDGFETACHGFTHAYLPSLTESGIIKEIGDDYDEIFRLTGKKPRGIAYAGPTPELQRSGDKSDTEKPPPLLRKNDRRNARLFSAAGFFALEPYMPVPRRRTVAACGRIFRSYAAEKRRAVFRLGAFLRIRSGA